MNFHASRFAARSDLCSTLFAQGPGAGPHKLQLDSGSRVAVAGGRPEGIFFSDFLIYL